MTQANLTVTDAVDSLDQYLAGMRNLPPTPVLLVQLIGLFQKPDRDLDDIVVLTRRDPVLATEVLRQCNATFFGIGAKVSDINEALFRLGFHEVYRLTVLLFGRQMLRANSVSPRIPMEAFRRHSSITAIASGAIAGLVGEPEGLAFTAGLLHDIGKVVLAISEGDRYAEMIRLHGPSGEALCHSEKETFGFDHTEIGARLLNRWELPESISAPALFHHHGDSGEFGRSVAIVRLANLLAHHLDDPDPTSWCETSEAYFAAEPLNLVLDDLLNVAKAVDSQIKLLPALFNN
jgi:putative nucleotidyltransferase with HDIG domain